jgi:hypothetical protein
MIRAFVLTFIVAAVLFFITQPTGSTIAATKKVATENKEQPQKSKPVKQLRKPDQYEPTAEEQQFAKKIFLALKQGNGALWLSLYPNDMLERVARLRQEYSDQPLLMSKKLQEFMTQEQVHNTELLALTFAKLQEQAIREELDFSSAQYNGFIGTKHKTASGTDSLHGEIMMQSNDTEFVIERASIVKTAQGYRLQGTGRIRKVEKEE